MKIENITIAEYLALEDKEQYNFALKYAEEAQARDVLAFGDLVKKTFGEVKDYQYLFTKEDYIVRFVNLYGAEKLSHLSVFEFFAFIRYVCQQVERVTEIENKLLSHMPSNEEVDAGLDRFNKYGSFSQLNSLANGNILNFAEIRKLPYEDALTKLAYDKDVNEYQKDLNKVLTRKHSHNG